MNHTAESSSENRLGTMPVGKLLLTMSLPMMVSFFIQALYNIVDSMFVARISENALTAVSLAFPMQQIASAISVGFGVGVNANIPRFLAGKDRARADRTTGCAIFLALSFTVLFALLGLFAVRSIYTFQTDVEEIVEFGTLYLSICWTLCIGVFLGQIFEKLLVCTGHSSLAMLAQASGAVINLIFDPLLIFGIGPFPELGIAGAAAATVMGQILAAAIAFGLNLRYNTSVRLDIRGVRPDRTALTDIISVGLPSTVTMGLSSLTGFVINQILLGYSTTATAVYGIWVKLQNFCHMPMFGMNNGTVPILSYNYARGLKDRVHQAMRLAVTFCVSYLVILSIVLELIPGTLLTLFSASDAMREIGVTALRICILSLPCGGLTVILGSAMQAMQHASYALAVNILRQFIALVGLFALLSALTHSLDLVWFAVPIAELITVIAAILLTRRMLRRLWDRSSPA